MRVLYPGHIGIWRCWFLSREENWRTRRKTLAARREPTTNSTHVWHRAGIEPAYVGGGERFHHCIPASLGLKAAQLTRINTLTFNLTIFFLFMDAPNYLAEFWLISAIGGSAVGIVQASSSSIPRKYEHGLGLLQKSSSSSWAEVNPFCSDLRF